MYYLITGISGWYLWARVGTNKNTDEKVLITTNSLRSNLYWVAGIAGASLLTGWIVSNLHIWLPTLFPGTSITTASRRRLHHDRLRRAVPHDAPQA